MNYKKITGSLLLLAILSMAPITITNAQDKAHFWADGGVGAFINADSMVRVFGATITAVNGSVINATTAIGGTILNWIVNVNADTKIFADGMQGASTTALTLGEKIGFTGTATATSSAATVVSAKKIVDESWKNFRKIVGEVTAVNSASGSYTVETKGDKTITVQTNADTEWKVGTTTGGFNSVAVGSMIHALGTLSADASVLTANTIVVRTDALLGDLRERWNEWKEARREARDNDDDSDAKDRGLHLGLKHFLGAGLGLGL